MSHIPPAPIDMVLHCPACSLQHIDAPDTNYDPHYEGHMIWENPPHRSHLCHGCGHIWRPADVATNGVQAVKTKGKADSPEPDFHCETEAQGYAMEALWQFLPDLPIREDSRALLTPAQFETVLRRCGWIAPCDSRTPICSNCGGLFKDELQCKLHQPVVASQPPSSNASTV